MPRAKAQAESSDLPDVTTFLTGLPQEITEVLMAFKNKKVTPKNAQKYAEKLHCAVMPHMLPRLYMALAVLLVDTKDLKTLVTGFQVFGQLAVPGQTSITNQIINQTAISSAVTEEKSSWSFDSVVRRLEEGRNGNGQPKMIDVTPATEQVDAHSGS